jgi:VWFA-related protein
MRVICRSTLIVLVSCAALSLPARGQVRADRTLRSGVDVVMVTATVLDENNQPVTGLEQDAFEVYEDGVPQSITQFTHERVPVGLGMLLDVSDSMFGQRMLDARRTVERFLLELLSQDDMFFVMAFNHAPRLMTRWTSEPDVIRRALEDLRPTGGTAIYDALLQAIPMIQGRSRQRAAIVVISDGADTASDASIGDVRTALLRSDAFVYAVAIDSPKRQAINTRVNPVALGEITNQSGGHTAVVRDAEEMAAATARIAEELNSQYLLGYPSTRAADGKYHSIRVKIRGEGYKVRARNGYVGGRPGAPRR